MVHAGGVCKYSEAGNLLGLVQNSEAVLPDCGGHSIKGEETAGGREGDERKNGGLHCLAVKF